LLEAVIFILQQTFWRFLWWWRCKSSSGLWCRVVTS